MRENKIIKQGKKIDSTNIAENEKDAKRRSLIQYIIPLTLVFIIGIIYIFIQLNILLIPFGILMFVVLWGGDCSSRTCPNCKKWNSVVWTKTERRVRKTTVSKKNIFNKETKKKIKTKYLRMNGECKNCKCEFTTEKNRML